MKIEFVGNRPIKNYANDAGADLISGVDVELVGLESILENLSVELDIDEDKMRVDVPTGTRVSIPAGYVGLVCDRSGMGKRRIKVFGGVIDSGYVGEIVVMLTNFSKTVNIKKGDKIAQLLIMPVASVNYEMVDKLEETDRGIKGFGSTG